MLDNARGLSVFVCESALTQAEHHPHPSIQIGFCCPKGVAYHLPKDHLGSHVGQIIVISLAFAIGIYREQHSDHGDRRY